MMAYVYRHIRHDKNEPFYIGIGKTRYRFSEKQNRNDIWNKITKKTSFDVEILFENVTWDFACNKEIELIKLYGRINKGTGTLANMTDGGDGNLGCVHSSDGLKRISESSKNRKGYWNGKKLSEDSKKKMSMSKKGKPILSLRGRKRPDNVIESVRNHSYGNKYHLGKKHSDESILKMRFNRSLRPVIQCDLYDNILYQFVSIQEAARVNNILGSGISHCCRDKIKTYKGFIWRYKKIE